MTAAAQPIVREHGNAYNIFILLLTIQSLAVMVLMILPLERSGARGPAVLRQRDLRHLPDRLCLQPDRLEAETPILHLPPRLARPARIDSIVGDPSLHGPVPPRAAQPAGPDHAAARRPESEGADRRRGPEPRPVRAVHHVPLRLPRAIRRDRARAAVRKPQPGCEHRQRRRRALVGHGDDHDRRVRRLLPGDLPRAVDRSVRDVRGRRDHRVAREHPGQHPRAGRSCRSPRRKPPNRKSLRRLPRHPATARSNPSSRRSGSS